MGIDRAILYDCSMLGPSRYVELGGTLTGFDVGCTAQNCLENVDINFIWPRISLFWFFTAKTLTKFNLHNQISKCSLPFILVTSPVYGHYLPILYSQGNYDDLFYIPHHRPFIVTLLALVLDCEPFAPTFFAIFIMLPPILAFLTWFFWIVALGIKLTPGTTYLSLILNFYLLA